MDWIAAILYLVGAWLIGNKRKAGFLFYLAELMIWCLIALEYELTGFLPIVVVGLFVNIRNYVKWTYSEAD